jgi:UDP-glucose 4-epimerase
MEDATGRELDVRYADFRAGEVVQTWCEIDKAREGFGFHPTTSLDEGIRKTWAWFLAQNERN